MKYNLCARDYTQPFIFILDNPMEYLQGGDIALAALSGCKGTEKICVHLLHLFYGYEVGMGINKD